MQPKLFYIDTENHLVLCPCPALAPRTIKGFRHFGGYAERKHATPVILVRKIVILILVKRF